MAKMNDTTPAPDAVAELLDSVAEMVDETKPGNGAPIHKMLATARAQHAAEVEALKAGDKLADETGMWVRIDDRRIGSIKVQRAVTAYRAARAKAGL